MKVYINHFWFILLNINVTYILLTKCRFSFMFLCLLIRCCCHPVHLHNIVTAVFPNLSFIYFHLMCPWHIWVICPIMFYCITQLFYIFLCVCCVFFVFFLLVHIPVSHINDKNFILYYMILNHRHTVCFCKCTLLFIFVPLSLSHTHTHTHTVSCSVICWGDSAY